MQMSQITFVMAMNQFIDTPVKDIGSGNMVAKIYPGVDIFHKWANNMVWIRFTDTGENYEITSEEQLKSILALYEANKSAGTKAFGTRVYAYCQQNMKKIEDQGVKE